MPKHAHQQQRLSAPRTPARARRMNPDIDPIKRQYEASIREGMARYLWIASFADWAEGSDVVQDAETSVDLRGTSGVEWDDAAPETPKAAEQAAKDLVDLFVVGEKLSGDTPMTELFELAMTVHQGETFELATDDQPVFGLVTRMQIRKKGSRSAWEWKTVPLTGEGGALDVAYEFGSLMAAEALGQGVAWSDDYRVSDDHGNDFDPSVPNFECHYDGDSFTWSGATRERKDGKRASGHETAPRWRRFGHDDDEGEAAEQFPRIGRITVVNPGDQHTWTRTHSYVLWFDAHAPLYLMAYSDSLDSALDECVDWIEDQNLPGYFVDDAVNEETQRLIQEDPDLDEDEAFEQASANTTTAGNHGHMLNSEDWGVEAEDPSPAILRRIGRVDEMQQEAREQREFDQRSADLRRPRIWVSEIASQEAELLLHGRVDDSLRLVPREGRGAPAAGEYGPAVFGSSSADVDMGYVIAYLRSVGPLEPRWNTGHLAQNFVPRTWYLGPSDGAERSMRPTYVLENFTHDQQRQIFDAVVNA